MITAYYVRVSSKSQQHASQLPDLEAHAQQQKGEVRWYKDTFSGRTMERPGMDALLADLRAGRVQTLVVWRLDRLGRTAVGLVKLFDELRELSVNLVSLRDGINLATPAGRLIANVLASVASYETEVRAERQRAGIEAARDPDTGKCGWGGRKPGTMTKRTRELDDHVRALHGQGTAVAKIARLTHLSRPTVYAILRKANAVRGRRLKTTAARETAAQ